MRFRAIAAALYLALPLAAVASTIAPLSARSSAATVSPVGLPPTEATGTTKLDAIACPSPPACYAVGGSSIAKSPGYLSEVVTPLYNGVPGTPVPPQGTEGLGAQKIDFEAIACPSSSTCIAVGDCYYQCNPKPLCSSAPSWSPVFDVVQIGASGAPLPASPTLLTGTGAACNELLAIACPSATSCYAVGTDGLEVAIQVGATISATTIAQGPTTLDLNGIACTSTSTCYALGACTNFGETCSDNSGQVVTMSVSDGSISGCVAGTCSQSVSAIGYDLYGISCQGSSCYAVGNNSQYGVVVCLHSGGECDTGQAPWCSADNINCLPAQTIDSTTLLFAVACPQTSDCVAVGYAPQDARSPVPDGGAIVPIVAGQFEGVQQISGSSRLVGVDCYAPLACYAVGQLDDGLYPVRALGNAIAEIGIASIVTLAH